MTIGRICQKQLDTAEPNETARVAAHRMASRGVGALLVLAGNKPVGILTDRDIALRVCGEGRDANLVTVAEVMSTGLHMVVERSPIESALETMRAHGLRRLPVVSRDGEALGIVTLDDVLALLAEQMSAIGRVVELSSPRALAEP